MLLYKTQLVYIISNEREVFILQCNVFIEKKCSFKKVKNKCTISFDTSHRWLVPVKFVYVLVHMSYFLAVKYKHKL